jgi:flavin reductase (DIM6/NTAB) family NADH-FMN oxidoreductase RutF
MLIDIKKDAWPVSRLYRLVTSAAVPRPIALVSSYSEKGVNNLAPFSYFNFVSTDPLMLMFAPILGNEGQEKDTLRNIGATKEFAVAIVTEEILGAVNQTSADYPPEVDEFKEAGLTPRKATKIKAALVAESPINFECRLHDIVRFGNHPYAGNVVFGEVAAIHIDDGVLNEKHLVDPRKLKAVGRMGQSSYLRTTDLIELPRPKLLEPK